MAAPPDEPTLASLQDIDAAALRRLAADGGHLRRQLLDAIVYARDLLEASVDATMAVVRDGVVVAANAAAEAMMRRTRQQLVGAHFSGCFCDPAAACVALHQSLMDGAVRDLALVVRRADGGTTEVNCAVTPYRDGAGAVCGAFVVVRDCTDMRQAQLQMQFQADFDPLTALPNRRQFVECLERAIGRSKRGGGLVAVMLIDLDDFKDINATVGHGGGDDLLKTIGSRLFQAVRGGDTLARIGGDEFAVLAEGLTGLNEVQASAEELRQAIAAPLLLEGHETTVTCSVGIAVFPVNPGAAETLLRNADTAMYCAKAAGKNNYRFFTADMNVAVQRRVHLGNRLRGALRRGELSLHYQPQIRLDTGAVTGVEVLLRWHAEGIGMVPPGEFVPIAEDSGLILPIGTWVLAQACRQAAQWRMQTGDDMAVAVNLSARQFRDADIVATVARALDESGLPSRLLELELTESMLMRDASRAADTMMRLKATGVRIAIDDFGTGYSSLGYLKRFPLDCLKIDRSFVADVPGSRSDEAIVRAVIALGHSLGYKVIAEGVETAVQMDFLREAGCDEIQGYYVSEPRPALDLFGFLLAKRCQQPVDEGLFSQCSSIAT